MAKKNVREQRSTDSTAVAKRRAAGPASCRMTPDDAARFSEGKHYQLYGRLGAHPAKQGGERGVAFSVWAPAAQTVSVVGSFNDWDPKRDPLERAGDSGIWSGFVADVDQGALYKFHIESKFAGYRVDKADPFATRFQNPPETASVVWDLHYDWNDAAWMEQRGKRMAADAPMSTYEIHLGSWKRSEPGQMPGYRELAAELVPYIKQMGFTHVELLPPMEHPFYGSWGYQTTGYFAPTTRYGSPQDFMYLIDQLHRNEIGVLLDWVPSHFPGDEHGLVFFDGTHLFEHADPRQGYHPDWTSHIFNYGRGEVCSFLISNAMFWLERYHIDGLRVDAVASMLYRDYSREEGQWIPNEYGGRENLEAIAFLRQLNQAVHEQFPEVRLIAEESTAWPMVSQPEYVGGLGFDMKWDMGWMHDTLLYMGHDPVHRKFHQNTLTFRMLYAFSEKFVLALSHDEVVHGKSSLLGKMSGDHWQQFANLRTLFGYMYGQPGKKLLFMGAELGQWKEWNHDDELDWDLLRYPRHAGLKLWVEDLNRFYREQKALHELDFDGAGFEWIDCADADQSVISFVRRGHADAPPVLVVCNLTPVPRYNYRVGAPEDGVWHEALNSDAECYGGSGVGNLGEVLSTPIRYHDRDHSLLLTLPPLSVQFFVHQALEERVPGAVPELSE